MNTLKQAFTASTLNLNLFIITLQNKFYMQIKYRNFHIYYYLFTKMWFGTNKYEFKHWYNEFVFLKEYNNLYYPSSFYI